VKQPPIQANGYYRSLRRRSQRPPNAGLMGEELFPFTRSHNESTILPLAWHDAQARQKLPDYAASLKRCVWRRLASRSPPATPLGPRDVVRDAAHAGDRDSSPRCNRTGFGRYSGDQSECGSGALREMVTSTPTNNHGTIRGRLPWYIFGTREKGNR